MKFSRQKHSTVTTYHATAEDGTTFEIQPREGLTWQDPRYWVLFLDGSLLRIGHNQRPRRFRTLADAKAYAEILRERLCLV